MKFRYWTCAALTLSSLSVNARAMETSDLFLMSLEELLNVNISTGSLESEAYKDSPLALTVIHQEQIQTSTARNLAVLLEQYVPGLIVMAHSQGDKIGMRGHIAAENYKLLLLVNGKNMTNMVYEGVFTEIDQWQLGDIEKVEVIRGPGSVTYGSGAIGGVINIITKKANHTGVELSLSHDTEFGSKGFDVQYGGKLADFDTYTYLSYRQTDGIQSPDYFLLGVDETSDIRFVGKRPSDSFGPQAYLVDTLNRPQIKAHFDIDFSDNLSAWARYTQSGQSHGFVAQKQLQNTGKVVDSTGVSLRSFASSLDFNHALSQDSQVRISATYDSQEYIRYDLKNPQFGRKDPANIKDYAFSQNRFVTQALFDHKWSEQLDLSIGLEFNFIHVGAPWGKSDDHLWIREGVHFVSDAETSVYTQDLSLSSRPKLEGLEEVGGGIDFFTYTNLLELSYAYSDKSNLRYSHRLDVSDVSSNMFSPRVSFVSELNDNTTWSLVLQRAQRMAPLRAQYLFDKYYSDTEDTKHEEQDSIELAITNTSLENLSLTLRSFYNSVQAVGYTGSRLEVLNENDLIGIETEGHYRSGNAEFKFSHSYLDAFNITMNHELKDGTNRNNISFADYMYYTRGDIPLLLTGYGDSLNNVPTNVSKLIFNYQMLDGKLLMHLNAQMIWDLEGSVDERRMYQQAYDNFNTASLSSEELALFNAQMSEFEREMAILDKEDPFSNNYMVSASLTYHWLYNNDIKISLSAYMNNIFDSFERTYVSTGSTNHFPNRLSFINEPRTAGLNLNIEF